MNLTTDVSIVVLLPYGRHVLNRLGSVDNYTKRNTRRDYRAVSNRLVRFSRFRADRFDQDGPVDSMRVVTVVSSAKNVRLLFG